MRSLLVLVALGLGACAKAPPPRVAKAVIAPPRDPAELMQRLYDAVAQDDAEALGAFFAADATVFGLGPADTWFSREALIAGVERELSALSLSGDSVAFTDSEVRVGYAADGTSAWLYDSPKATLTVGAKQTVWLPRLTAHLVLQEEQWLVDALHLSIGVPDAKTFAPEAAKTYLPPFELISSRGKDSEAIIGLTKRMLEDITVKVNRISERDDVVLLGTDSGDVYLPGKAFKDLVKPRLSELKKGYVPVKVDGQLRSRLGPGGKTGWVAANILVKTGTGKKVQTLPIFRALWIFIEEKDVWDIVSEHQSLAVRPEHRESATPDDLKARAQRKLTAPKVRSGPPPPKGKRGKDEGISTFE